MDPTRGRDIIKKRVAAKIHRILELAASGEMDDRIKSSLRDAMQERFDRWDAATQLDVLMFYRQLGPREAGGPGAQN